MPDHLLRRTSLAAAWRGEREGDGLEQIVNKPPTRLSAASGVFLSAAALSLIIVGGELDFFAWRRPL